MFRPAPSRAGDGRAALRARWFLPRPSCVPRERQINEQGIARVLNACASVCPEAASRWVEQLPAGAIRDSAIGAYVEAASAWHPEAAARLALKTSDPVQRRQRVEQCFPVWFAFDPDAAKRWLKETDFPEETGTRLLAGKRPAQF